jgi:predicted Zn-dependent protease
MLGHASAGSAPSQAPDRVAVVRVQAGETLERLAERVAPDRPASQVMQRIRELNKLGAASVQAGQTLISPIG